MTPTRTVTPTLTPILTLTLTLAPTLTLTVRMLAVLREPSRRLHSAYYFWPQYRRRYGSACRTTLGLTLALALALNPSPKP